MRLSCRPPYSFYHDFIPAFWSGGMNEVEDAPIHRMCTLARKMGVRSLVVEDAGDRPEIVQEITHLAEFTGAEDGEWQASSVTFLRSEAPAYGEGGVPDAADVIGQVVIVSFPNGEGERSYVFEAVMRLCATRDGTLLLNNHVHLDRRQSIEVAGGRIDVAGSYFCQQNGVTSLCGHTAVRTLIANRSGERVSVEALNREWSYDAKSRRLPADSVENALRSRGLHVVCYDFRGRRPGSGSGDDGTWTVLAGLVESATPSLLIMSTGPRVDHVVPLLGYTINTDEWHPSGAQVHLADKDGTASSSLWIDHLLLNDDQLGPYYCLSRAGLFEKSGHASAVTPQRVIAVLPEGAQVSPLRAELTARGGIRRLLSAMLSWHRGMELPRWLSLLAETRERRVFRTILVDRETYVGELRARPELGEDGPAIGRLEAVAAILPDRFWMVEVSLPNILLANRSRLGEILVAPSGETPRILLARMPGVIGALKDDDLDLSRFPMETYVPMHSSGENSNTW